jgi:hypothetical protein
MRAIVGMGYLFELALEYEYIINKRRIRRGQCQRNIRQQPSKQSIQIIFKESRRRERPFKVQPIAEEFLDSACRNQHAVREAMLDDIEGQQERLDEFWGQSVLAWRGECEQIDVFVLLPVRWDGAGEISIGG